MNLYNLLLGSKTFKILNYPLPLWGFSGIMKQINLNGKTRLKIPTGRNGGTPVGLFTSVAVDLSSGLPKTNPASS